MIAIYWLYAFKNGLLIIGEGYPVPYVNRFDAEIDALFEQGQGTYDSWGIIEDVGFLP